MAAEVGPVGYIGFAMKRWMLGRKEGVDVHMGILAAQVHSLGLENSLFAVTSDCRSADPEAAVEVEAEAGWCVGVKLGMDSWWNWVEDSQEDIG